MDFGKDLLFFIGDLEFFDIIGDFRFPLHCGSLNSFIDLCGVIFLKHRDVAHATNVIICFEVLNWLCRPMWILFSNAGGIGCLKTLTKLHQCWLGFKDPAV